MKSCSQGPGVATYQLSAVLDTRTTENCQGLDGRTFAYSDAKAPRPSLHPGCRTVMIPVFDGEAPINEKTTRNGWLVRRSYSDRSLGHDKVPGVESREELGGLR